MQPKYLIAGLLALAIPALAQPDAPTDSEFHDPFAAEDAGAGSQPHAAAISDPLEPVNRVFFRFNDKLYCWFLRPVARGYRAVAPRPVRECVDRAYANVKFPIRFVNNLLEFRFGSAGIETARFAVNTTVGVAGLFDPASRWKLKAQPASFDQTLAFYRLPPGIYLNWPLLGPSSVRGTVGLAGDAVLNPVFYIDSVWVRAGVSGLERVNATSLQIEKYDAFRSGTLDPYAALRSAYFDNLRSVRDSQAR